MAAGQTAVYVARPVTSYRLLSLGSGAGTVGLVTAAYALLPLFLAVPLGRFADRRRAVPLLAGGSALEVLGCLFLSLGRTPLALAAASAVLGLGHLALALGVQSAIARESADHRHDQHFGLLTAAVALGQLLGPLLAGAVLGDESGDALTAATTRALVAAAGVASAAAVCAVVAERARGAAPPPEHSGERGNVRGILRIRGVPAAIFASIAVLSAADVFTAYMPVLGEERGITPGVVGAILAVRAAASMGGRIGIGTLVGLLGRARLITVSATVAAAAFAAFTLSDETAVLFVLSAIAGLGLGFGQPLSMTMVVQLVPEHARATALGVRLTGNRVGQVAAPALAGLVAGSAGAGPVFWLVSGTLVASALAVQRTALAALVRRRAAPPAEASVEPTLE